MNIPDDKIAVIKAAKDDKFRCEALEFAYDAAIRRLHFTNTILDFLSIVVAVGFLYVLYIVKKDKDNTLHDLISIIGTGASLGVIFLIIWSHISKWPGQIEKKSEMSKMLRSLIDDYENIMVNYDDNERIEECRQMKSKFDQMRKHELSTLKRKDIILGHQHVAMKYPDEDIKCTVCGRVWEYKFAKWRKLKNIIPFIGCEGCGV